MDSRKGFSLVEMLMAVGLLGGVLLGVMTMTSNMTKTSLKTSTSGEITQATNEIFSILSDATNCTRSLGGKLVLSDATTATIFYKDIEKFKVGRIFGSTNEKIVSFVIAATASEAAANTSVLTINYQKKSSLGGGTLPKRVNLYVEIAPTGTVTATSTIVSCSALAGTTSTSDGYLPWETITASVTPIYNANVKGRYFIDTTAGTVTATLPATPSIGDSIQFVDVAGRFDVHKLIVARNGKLIMGHYEDMDVPKKYISFELIFSGDTYGWRIK